MTLDGPTARDLAREITMRAIDQHRLNPKDAVAFFWQTYKALLSEPEDSRQQEK